MTMDDAQLYRSAMAARRQAARQSVGEFRTHVMRCRVDHHWLPSGEIEAILTISLPDNHAFRFAATCDPKVLMQLIAAQNPGVGFSLKSLWKGVKKVAKGVATSKVFKMASTALASIAPALGPLGAPALAAAAAMKGTTALLAARTHAAKGDPASKAKAAALVKYAEKATRAASNQPVVQAAARNTAQAHSAKLFTMMLKPA